LGFDELRKNDDAMRTISDSSAKASTSENMRPPLQYPPVSRQMKGRSTVTVMVIGVEWVKPGAERGK
jgi:hypothetical protein